ncbi:MAG: glycosyltransferase [Anaerolineae bacterium]
MTARHIQRIAMLSVHTCPLATLGGKKTGGMNVYVRDLSREFSRRGIAVDVFTRSQDPCAPHISNALAEHARVLHVPAGPEMPLDVSAIYPHLPQFVENVLQYVAHNRLAYDLIFSHYWLSGWVGHELRARWRIPLVQMFHTLGHMKNRVAGQQTEGVEPARDIRVFTETDIMSWADCLIAATPAERAQMLWLYQADRRKIHVVPPGVDLNHFRPLDRAMAKNTIGVPLEHKMLLFVGRIEPLKGIDTLLKAMAFIRQQRPQLCAGICLSIIGGDPHDLADENTELARLKELSQALGLHDLVTFLGAKDQDRLRYYYNAAEVLIMPSDYESFGMVALEAMACGTPVIASEVGGLVYLIRDGHNGFHVPVREPEALARRIIGLLERPELRAAMSRAALESARRYGWPDIAERLLAIFTALPAPTSGRSPVLSPV